MLKEIEVLASRRFLPIIGPERGRYLAETVRKYRPVTVLEVGTLIGYSTILIATNLPAGGRVLTIEINPGSAKRAEENIEKAGMSARVEQYVGNALQVIPDIKKELDMVFLDAAKDEYLRYLKLCEGRLRKSGVVFADNVKMFARDMADYLDYVRKSGRYRSQFIGAGSDAVEISVKVV